MGVQVADTAASPAPAAEVEVQTPAAEAPITDATIEDYNKSVEAEIAKAEGAAPEPALEPEPEAEPEVEPKTDVKEEEKETAADETGEAAVESVITFAAEDTPEEYQAKKEYILEGFEEVPAEITSLIEHLEGQVAAASANTDLDRFANKEAVLEIGSAIDLLYGDTEIDGEKGTVTLNAKPLGEVFRTRMPEAVAPLAYELFVSDSQKYQGASLYQEFLIDMFGPDKAQKMGDFALADAPLPVVPAALVLPQGVDEANKEAYWQLSERKRFEIDSLVDEINNLSAEASDASEWRKEEIGSALAEKRGKLSDEIFAIENLQSRIDDNKVTAERTARQNAANTVTFRNTVTETYNGEIFEMADGFAKDLAPKLTFADSDTQLSQARNIMSRVQNALAFIVDKHTGEIEADPLAEFYAKQLSEEGVKFDFVKGRDLLQKHYKAVEHVQALKKENAPAQSIAVAEKRKSSLMFDIKVEQKQLLGQLSSKYVKSNGSALGKQIEAVKEKKQITRKILPGQSASAKSNRPVETDIAEYNRKVAAATPDEMYEAYQ